jgi:pimeloyl-ACP methyl ester carboxylesterase
MILFLNLLLKIKENSMIRTIPFENTDIRFSDKGSGTAVVLLHGYLESLQIWNGFAGILEERFRVICPDLPGHGESGIIGEVHSMEKLAGSVLAVLDHCGIDKCFIVGHSMGGYSGLAFMELYPERLQGICLFHSHPFPDTLQTMQNRCREIVLVKQGRKELISKINIPKAFAPKNVDLLKSELGKAKEIAISTPDEGIIACLNGMMARPSREALLAETNIPVMLIAGKHDNYIPFEDIAKKTRLPEGALFVTLENSGHIGFLEEPAKSAKEISGFVSAHS